MFEKIKNLLKEKDEKKKVENLVVFLIILVVTLVLINKILDDDSTNNEGMNQNQTGIQLVSNKNDEIKSVDDFENDDLAQKLEDILSKINGVGQVKVLITYQKENPLKIEGAIVIAEGVRKY